MNRRNNGFTLVELMVASVIGLFIAAISVGALTMVSGSARVVDLHSETANELTVAAEFLRTDLHNFYRDVSQQHMKLIGVLEPLDEENFASRLIFYCVNRNPARPHQPESDVYEVEYMLMDRDEKRVLIRRLWPNPDRNARPAGLVTVIADNVELFEVRYYDGSGWLPAWPEEMPGICDLLEVTLASRIPESGTILSQSFMVNLSGVAAGDFLEGASSTEAETATSSDQQNQQNQQDRPARLEGGNKMKSTNCKETGLVLVGVLWLAVLLIVLATTVAATARLDSKLRFVSDSRLSCRWANRAGLETAIAVLKEDMREGDGLTDLWSENPDEFNDLRIGECLVRIRITDEASKLNINKASKQQLMSLPDMTAEIVDAIIDWRDRNDEPEPTGVEVGYYRNLPFGYQIRNGQFRTIRELLLVKDVPPEIFFGEDTNYNSKLDYNERDGDETDPLDDGDDEIDFGWIDYLTCYSYDLNRDAEGNTRTNVNQADRDTLARQLDITQPQAKWIVDKRGSGKLNNIADLIDESSPKEPPKNPPRDPNQGQKLDLKTFGRIADKITVTNNDRIMGLVNINTADEIVLASLLSGDTAQITGEKIVSHRLGLAEPMVTIAELLNVSGISVNTFKQLADKITVRSNVFTVRCSAQDRPEALDGAQMFSEVVVDRTLPSGRILYCYQGVAN